MEEVLFEKFLPIGSVVSVQWKGCFHPMEGWLPPNGKIASKL